MARPFVTESEPHRDLILSDAHGWQRGNDIKLLTRAARRRLAARGIERELHDDGELDRETFAAFQTAGRYLGALESTLQQRDSHGREIIRVGVQRMIRYPGRRSPEQLNRAEERFAALIAERERRAREEARQDDEGGVSGLSRGQRIDARDRAVAAMRLLLAHEPAVHYTQGPRRWDGIRLRLRSADGRFPRYADCSSATTWALWNALTGVAGMDFKDIVNGSGWSAGYTGTQLAHGRPVRLDALMPGDLVFYGTPGSTGRHVAMVDEDRSTVISHGSEGGPYDIRIRYRSDVMGARRYI